jgi:hypothetical protein
VLTYLDNKGHDMNDVDQGLRNLKFDERKHHVSTVTELMLFELSRKHHVRTVTELMLFDLLHVRLAQFDA